MLHRRLAQVGVVVSCAMVIASGCTSAKPENVPRVPGATKASYTLDEVKAAFYNAEDAGPSHIDFWYDRDQHDHNNYVPPGELQVCPLAQRSNAQGAPPNTVEMSGGEATRPFAVMPGSPNDTRQPRVMQNAFIFATPAIADSAMAEVEAAHAKCPPSFTVGGGPPTILGDYALSSRPLDVGGWKGYVQQVAHTFPEGVDDVYFEDMAVVVLKRANVILYLDLSHRRIVGERSDAPELAQDAVAHVLERLG